MLRVSPLRVNLSRMLKILVGKKNQKFQMKVLKIKLITTKSSKNTKKRTMMQTAMIFKAKRKRVMQK